MTWQCTPVIINYVSVSQLFYQTHPHTLFGMSLQLVFSAIRHFHIAHDAFCLIRPRSCPPPPPFKKKRKKKKKTICIRIIFNFTWVRTTFTKTIMHLVYPPKFALPLVSISLGTRVIPRRNCKQSLYIMHLFIYLFSFFGGGGGDINRVHYGLCANGEL